MRRALQLVGDVPDLALDVIEADKAGNADHKDSGHGNDCIYGKLSPQCHCLAPITDL